jgi:hypothetical protein
MEHNAGRRAETPFVAVEHRVTPDRRASWRGGRRDSDWFNRSVGAWRHVETRLSPWRVWVASWPLHHLRDDRPQGL